MTGLVVISCGRRKADRPAQARVFYTGHYFRSCRRAAEGLLPSLGWLILSAKYGLIRPTTVIEPYTIKMGRPGSVSPDRVRAQAEALGLLDADPVVVFAGPIYVRLLRHTWPGLVAPLENGALMGDQQRYMREVAERRSLT